IDLKRISLTIAAKAKGSEEVGEDSGLHEERLWGLLEGSPSRFKLLRWSVDSISKPIVELLLLLTHVNSVFTSMGSLALYFFKVENFMISLLIIFTLIIYKSH
ncbi:hypothetical protein ACJX0J_023717, partial [Zea mays]